MRYFFISNRFTVSIQADPEFVFAYVSDLPRHSEWNTGLTVEALAPGPMRVGSEYRSIGQPGNAMNIVTLTYYQPPTRFTFVASHSTFGDVTHEFVVRPDGAGALLDRIVTSSMRLHQALIWRWIVWPLIDRPSMNKSMAALKRRIEELQGK